MANVDAPLSVFLIIILLSVIEPSHIGPSHIGLPRFRVKEHGNTFRRGKLKDNFTAVKLILGTEGDIYAGGGQHLTQITFNKSLQKPTVKKIPIACGTQIHSIQKCLITVMQRGRGAYPLFVCTNEGERARCSYMDATGGRANTTNVYGGQEPALLIEDVLYTTQSATKDKDGIYRKHLHKGNDNMTPPSSRSGQTYVKLVDRSEQKLYAFYTEENNDQNPDSDMYTPRVSQICKADLGGSKDTLQFQWTSQLSSRLSCGDPRRKLYYPQLLDVVVLKAEDGQDDRVYGLFQNGWKMTAVCVYAMKDIDSIFSTSETRTPFSPNLGVPSSGRPGECVQDSKKLSPELLKYMKNSPETVDWVKPIEDSPLLVSHHHYNHIQVDRVGERHVLLLSMKSGAIHKVLENSSEPFIIADYHPFPPGTPILSMLLDSSEKKLYVSSSDEVVEIDLRNCSVYGNKCADCVLARDPYCGWDSNNQICAPYSQGLPQEFLISDQCPSVSISSAQSTDKFTSDKKFTSKSQTVPESSRHYLSCPVHSHHAVYHWLKDGRERESILDQEQEQLLVLIDSMRPEEEGHYVCEVQEGGYQSTVVQYQLSMRMTSGAVGMKSFGPLATTLLPLLFTLSC